MEEDKWRRTFTALIESRLFLLFWLLVDADKQIIRRALESDVGGHDEHNNAPSPSATELHGNNKTKKKKMKRKTGYSVSLLCCDRSSDLSFSLDFSVSYEIYKKAEKTPWGGAVGRREFFREDLGFPTKFFLGEEKDKIKHFFQSTLKIRSSRLFLYRCRRGCGCFFVLFVCFFTVCLRPFLTVMLSPRYPLALFLLLLSSHCQNCSQLRPKQLDLDPVKTNSLIGSDLLLSLLVNATSNSQFASTDDPELEMTTVRASRLARIVDDSGYK